ncbi:Gfo/Idh/MocA family protein [Flagellimonas algicola]|uniref:Gfo/Idh/MocA family oxidoreductase n=1 Tax=Flagellimonas algicola TaxID=2583815 RepID=A0ABY2WKP9_9FLAO|nr:Gfo/Idh/MocA family oxidoreductase [Allomuricauda algicola]TMU55405.1 Gfo/Idh/MocA family oxidoreductase [Allomuricauda algicola]
MTESLSFFNKTPIRWGVIGCGGVAEIKSVPAYQMAKDFEVVMVMRRDAEKVEDYARRHRVPQYTTNAQEVVESREVDAVYIATPPDSHKEYALLVAKAGKPCCIEKPMAPSYADSLAIYKAFEEKGLPLFIAYYRRSLPRFNQIKQWLDEEKIGEVRHIHWQKTKPPSEIDLNGNYNWRTDNEVAPGGYFDDLASHGLDLFVHLLGDIINAQGLAVNQLGLYSAYDNITGSWIHENGVTGAGVWNFGSYHREDKVEIFGSEGKITFAVLDEAPLILENGSEKIELEIPNPEHVQQYHVQNIQDHLNGISKHPSQGNSGLHTSWVMDKILGN